MFDRIFGTPLPEPVLTPSVRPADHAAFFSEHSTAADRRTIQVIAEYVESLGSPPRWWEIGNDNRPGYPQISFGRSSAA